MQPDAFDRIVATTLEKFGRIDVLINNAGIGQASVRADQRRNPIRFWEATPDQWSRFLAVNATVPTMVARAVVPHMLRARQGRIITVTTASTPWSARAICCTARARPLPSPRRPSWRLIWQAPASHAARRRRCRGAQQDAPAGDHGAAVALAGVRWCRERQRPALHRPIEPT